MSATATVPAYPRREGRRSPKRREAALALWAQPPPSSRASPPSPGGSKTETQGWLQEEHGLQLLARPRLPGRDLLRRTHLLRLCGRHLHHHHGPWGSAFFF